MLFDHKQDPEENFNISGKDNNAELVEYMHNLLSGQVIPNYPPYVNAGEDRVIFWPARTVLLRGAVKDDNKPEDAKIITQWSLIDGPADINIKDNASPATSVVFKMKGEYVLRLYASDGHMAGIDCLRVVVK